MTDEPECEGDFCEYTASADDAGARLDVFLSERSGLTRSAAAKLIADGAVRVQTGVAAKNYKLRAGDTVEVELPEIKPCEALPEDIPIDVVYEDADIIVVNKPSGMVVHPGAGNPRGTLVNALLWHEKDRGDGGLSGIGGVERPGIVHRIDRDTSGLLVVAKNDHAHNFLSEQLKTHDVSRIYYAICAGDFKEDSGTVDLPIGRNPNDRLKMAAFRGDPDGKTVRAAVTHYEVLERFDTGAKYGTRFSFVKFRLETGRTHQIRVHTAAIGHPILGDPLYGGAGNRFCSAHAGLIEGQCLHAGELTLTHPSGRGQMSFHADLPDNMKKILEILGNE